MVSERGLDVLRAIVTDYVESREPVGSKSIVDRHSFGVSAATIRNDMAQLEDEELIVAPHTSSGRIPTDKGYRVFVDKLADRRPLSVAQKQAIESFMAQSADLDDVLSRTVRLLSHLTNQVAVVQYPSLAKNRVRHLELVALSPGRVLSVLIADNGVVEQRSIDLRFEHGAPSHAEAAPISEVALHDLRDRVLTAVGRLDLAAAAEQVRVMLAETLAGSSSDAATGIPSLDAQLLAVIAEQISANRSDRIVMAGTANLVRTENDFSRNLPPLLDAIEEQVVLLKLFGELELDQTGMGISIGRENEAFGLEETSVLSTGYESSAQSISRLAVLGPTRMDYSGNIAAVRAVARYLSRMFGED
ncbi:heat-inducible transcriptional repressor HrcA [Lysinibacter cavernae]|uniref:Heat-inducible transcription repressor HrcA n=1 Tax=Lysinibacter cavernae TaxID=1640652 RepID=A0A7X5QZV9_9MICO|nr:heat-inducible transcriptional repressor HrcA [Lysinibacter cavernae]NIH53006.1 heat-inducible transcriptional repressor [Lysinibacter cavernae]